MVQPDVYKNFWDSVLWSFMQYIGDPGNFADYKPITFIGRIVAAIIGIIGIAIFAVPAGLIGSGFMDAISEDNKEKQLNQASIILHKRFRRSGQNNSWYKNEDGLKRNYKFVPRYKAMALLQVKTGLTLDELIATVNYCPDMRINNLSTTQRMADNPQDRLVVEHFPLNRAYGCFIDRGSDVTIVSTASFSHIGVGSSAFSLAAMGGFNIVSVEMDPCPDEPFGFFAMSKENLYLIGDYDIRENAESQALHFMDDLNNLKKNSTKRNRRHWFIFLHGSLKSEECQIHFRRNATDKKKRLTNRLINETENREYGSLVMSEDESVFNAIFEDIKKKLQERKVTIKGSEQNIVTEKDNFIRWKSFNDSNIMCRLGGGLDCNAFNIRIADEILVYCNFHLLIMKDIADSIKGCIEPEHPIDEDAKKCFLNGGDGYADDYGKTDVFETNPTKLKELLDLWKKDVLNRFEHLDLDGNEQADYAQHHRPPFWKRIFK